MTTREYEIIKVSVLIDAIMKTMIQRHAGAALMIAMLIEDIMEGMADDVRAHWRIIAAKMREVADEFTVKTRH